MLNVVKNVPRPQVTTKSHSTATKYPFPGMAVDDSFFVPKSQMFEGETPEKFRSRIRKAAANYARRQEGERPGYTVELMTARDDGSNSEVVYDEGDVGVWRDK